MILEINPPTFLTHVDMLARLGKRWDGVFEANLRGVGVDHEPWGLFRA